MNRKNKISTGKWLRSLILLMMMGWMGRAWAEDAATNIATGNKGSVYFDYNGIRVNGEPEKDKTYHITYNAGEHASGTSPEATWVEEGDLFKIPRNTTLYYEGNTLALWKDSKGEEMIYNLNGQQVDKTSARGGIFISRQKGKFYKTPGSSGGRR